MYLHHLNLTAGWQLGTKGLKSYLRNKDCETLEQVMGAAVPLPGSLTRPTQSQRRRVLAAKNSCLIPSPKNCTRGPTFPREAVLPLSPFLFFSSMLCSTSGTVEPGHALFHPAPFPDLSPVHCWLCKLNVLITLPSFPWILWTSVKPFLLLLL